MPNSDAPIKPRRCPICSDQVANDTYRPFCSRRCADVDLGRWLTGNYAIPGDINDDAADAPTASAIEVSAPTPRQGDDT